jgi:hypothetical protein
MEYSILVIKILSFISTSLAFTLLHISPSWPTRIFLILSLPTPTHPPLGLPTRLSLLSTLPLPAKQWRRRTPEAARQRAPWELPRGAASLEEQPGGAVELPLLLLRRRARIRSLPPVRRRGAADGLECGLKLLLELPPWRFSSNAAALLRRPYSCGSGGGGVRAVVTRSGGAPLQRRRWRIEQGLELHGRGREGRAQAGAEHGGGPSARGGAEWSSAAAFLPPSGAMCGGPVTGWRRPSITPDSKEPRGRRLFGVLLQDAAAGHFTGKGNGKKIHEGITYPGAGGLSHCKVLRGAHMAVK